MSSMTVIGHLRELRFRHSTLEETVASIGTDPKFFREVTTLPRRAARCKPGTLRNIALVHAEKCPRLLPSDYLNRERLAFSRAKANPGSPELVDAIIRLEGWLNDYKDVKSPVLRLQHAYMRVLANFSKAHHSAKKASWFGGAETWPLWFQKAESIASDAIALADEMLASEIDPEKRSETLRLQTLLFVNWVQIIQEQAKAGYKGADGVVRTPESSVSFFRANNVLGKIRKFLEAHPWIFQLAVNGLEIASTCESDDNARWFYGELKKCDPGFADFDYSPGECPSISAEPGMFWFATKYREQFHTDQGKA